LKKVLLCVETFAQLIDLLLLQSDLGLEELNFILSGGCSSGIVQRWVIVSGERGRDQYESRSASEEKDGGSHLSATLIWALGCRSIGLWRKIFSRQKCVKRPAVESARYAQKYEEKWKPDCTGRLTLRKVDPCFA
jgi:hypothetical protein